MTSFNSRNEKTTDEWITPKWITDVLGPFDLDPCAAIGQPWEHAENRYTIEDDGLNSIWFGRVWMNPPYGAECQQWVKKLADYGNGLALIPPRCGTGWFHDLVLMRAHSIFFMRGRIQFYDVNGVLINKTKDKHGKSRGGNNSDSCIIAYDQNNTDMLWEAIRQNPDKLKGRMIDL